MTDFTKMSDTDVITCHVRPKHPRFNSDILDLPERIDHEMDVQRLNKREIHRLLHTCEVFDEDGDMITFDCMNGRYPQLPAEEPVKPEPTPDEPGKDEPENPSEGGGEENPENPGEGGEENPEQPGGGEEENPENPGEGGGSEEPENPGEGGEENPDKPGDKEPENPNPPSGGGGQYWEDLGDLLG